MTLRLQQGQLWKHPNGYIRIVRLERLEVAYKTMKDLQAADGAHHHATKKEFCRLLKGCSLLDPGPVSRMRQAHDSSAAKA